MNDWTGATGKELLNTTYLNSLDSTSQSLISNAKYYLGGLGVESADKQGGIKAFQTTGVQLYSYERKIQNGNCSYDSASECYLGTECYYYGTNPNSWTGKIGLIYSSDYFYASSNCENKMIYDPSNENIDNLPSGKDIMACNDTNWLYNLKVNEWHLTQISYMPVGVLALASFGDIFINGAASGEINDQLAARPVLYLTSSAKITGESGTSSNPYTLGL